MAFFEDITSSATELFNDGVDFVGDALSSAGDSISDAFSDMGGADKLNQNDLTTSGGKPFFQYPISLGASFKTYNATYESDPEKNDSHITGAAPETVSRTTGGEEPFVSFAFKTIAIKREEIPATKPVSAELALTAIKAKGAVYLAKVSMQTQTKGTKGLVFKAITAGGAALTATSALSSLSTAMTVMANNAKLNENPNRATRSHVALYMPPGITVQDGANYEGSSRAAIAAVNATVDGNVGTEDAYVGFAAMAGQGLIGGGVASAALGKVGVENAAGLAAVGELIHLTGQEDLRILGRALNPNEYMQFKSTQLRTFSMSFKFLPESAGESDQVTNIIKEFRTAIYPIKNSAITLVVPDILEVNFHGAEGMVNMPDVVLTSVNVTYNPNSASFFTHGQTPVEATMSIEMQEIHPIHRADVTGPGGK